MRKSSELNAHFQSADSNVHPNDSLLLNLKGTSTVSLQSNMRASFLTLLTGRVLSSGVLHNQCAIFKSVINGIPAHNSLNIQPIPYLIHRLTDKFFAHWPLHPNPLVQQIWNYTLADLTNLYKKYKHKSTRHILF